MNFKLFFISLCVLSLSIAGISYTHAQEVQPKSTGSESTAVEVGNKTCPVSGEKVDEVGEPFKYEYNGKIYNLCCPTCAKDFKKDPEKYSKIAEEEVKKQKMSDMEGMDHGIVNPEQIPDHADHDHR